jgi:hypothetical protein
MSESEKGVNVSSVHLDTLGIIRNFQWIAGIESWPLKHTVSPMGYIHLKHPPPNCHRWLMENNIPAGHVESILLSKSQVLGSNINFYI